MEQFKKYRCKIKIRPEYEGRKPKPECLKLNDVISDFQVMFWMDKEDNYPDEWALVPVVCNLFRGANIVWIASGDVEVLEEIL